MSKERAKKYEQAILRMKALVVADQLHGRFEALENNNAPQCLFKIANVTHIRYTIEFLMLNQIRDIVIAAKKSNVAKIQ